MHWMVILNVNVRYVRWCSIENYTLYLFAVLQNCKLKKKLASITDNTKFLNTDQHRYLESSTQYKNKGVTWSVETLKTAFRMRFICGVQGYEFVRHLGYPLPAYRTLCNRITHAQFKPGIQSDVIKWLYYKLITMRDNEKECSLMLDEMQVRKSLEYDNGLCSFIGCVTDVVSSVKATQSPYSCFHCYLHNDGHLHRWYILTCWGDS